MRRLLILALFLLLAPVSQAADKAVAQPAAPPVAESLQSKSEALFAPLTVTPVQVDRDSARLIQKLTGSFQPWMWWVAGLLWAVLVVLVGKLLEHRRPGFTALASARTPYNIWVPITGDFERAAAIEIARHTGVKHPLRYV